MNNFLFVVVLYKVSMEQSETMRSLSRPRDLLKKKGLHVLVVDNTPGMKTESLILDSDIEYVSFGKNGGLAQAYQAAFLIAKAEDYRFLVLFDQDSEVDTGFILALDDITSKPETPAGIWCPDIVCEARQVSPYTLNAFGWPDFYPPKDSQGLHGINSFSVVNVSFLDSIGGFDEFYWLDCLDSWLYEKAHHGHWAVKRLNVSVNHDLSLVSGKITLSRMKIIAFYESCFVFEYGSAGRIAGTTLRLFLRGLKRAKMMGGVRNHWQYVSEIFKGALAGLKRRGNVASETTSRDG